MLPTHLSYGYTLDKYISDLHSHWINWIGLLRKSLRLRPFRALKEIADKTLETFAFHMTVRSAVRENVEQSIKGYLLTHCWTIAPPPILNERQWPHNNGTVKLFIPLHWVILVQLRGPKLQKKTFSSKHHKKLIPIFPVISNYWKLLLIAASGC